MSLDPFVPAQLPFLLSCLSSQGGNSGVVPQALPLFWMALGEEKQHPSHQTAPPQGPQAPLSCPRLPWPCPALQSCCPLTGKAKGAEGTIVTKQLGAISSALRAAGKTSRLPKGRGQRRQRKCGGSGGDWQGTEGHNQHSWSQPQSCSLAQSQVPQPLARKAAVTCWCHPTSHRAPEGPSQLPGNLPALCRMQLGERPWQILLRKGSGLGPLLCLQ